MAATILTRGSRRVHARAGLLALCLATALGLGAPVAAMAAPSISGCPVFPADNVWNTDISSLPVNAQSSAWLANMGGGARNLHPDFGSSGDPAAPYGIPFIVVDSTHAKVPVSFDYADESDPGPYPLGPDTPIEGGAGAGGDRHALMVDRSSCTLFELYDTHYSPGGSTAGSGAVFNLRANGPLRPAGWTSADAAGLPIFPGLLRPEEVQAGSVDHAIRFTAQSTDRKFIWPARHQAGSANNPALPPMGARFRLKASFDTSRFHGPAKVVLTAMKRYGLILADNGSNWFFQGSASNSWDDTMISELKTVPAGAFDAIDESSLAVDANSGQARQPGAAAGAGPGHAASRPLPAVPVASAPAAPAEAPAAANDGTRPGFAGAGVASTAPVPSVAAAAAGVRLPWGAAGLGAGGLLLAGTAGMAWLLRIRTR
jgi:hypothetical protein